MGISLLDKMSEVPRNSFLKKAKVYRYYDAEKTHLADILYATE